MGRRLRQPGVLTPEVTSLRTDGEFLGVQGRKQVLALREANALRSRSRGPLCVQAPSAPLSQTAPRAGDSPAGAARRPLPLRGRLIPETALAQRAATGCLRESVNV